MVLHLSGWTEGSQQSSSCAYTVRAWVGAGWGCHIAGTHLGRIKVSMTPDLAAIVPVVEELQA